MEFLTSRRPAVLLVLSQGTLGLGSYAIVSVAARSMVPEDFAQFALFWSVSFSIGLGLVAPLEQLVARSCAQGPDLATLGRLRRILQVVAVLGALGVAALFSSGIFPDTSQRGGALGVATAVCLALLFLQGYQRGVASGLGSPGTYARLTTADGLTRILLTVAALVGAAVMSGPAAWNSLWFWVLSVILAVLVSVVVAAPVIPRLGSPRDVKIASPPWPIAAEALKLFGVTTVGIVLANSLPAVVASLGATAAVTASYAAFVVISRVPLFFVGLTIPLLVPRISAVHRDGSQDVRAVLRPIVGGLTAAAALIMLATGLVTPPAVHLLLGNGYHVADIVPWLLGLSSGALFFGIALQVVVTTLQRVGPAAVVWSGAFVIFLVLLLVSSGSAEIRVSLAAAVASIVAAVGVYAVAWKPSLPGRAPIPDA